MARDAEAGLQLPRHVVARSWVRSQSWMLFSLMNCFRRCLPCRLWMNCAWPFCFLAPTCCFRSGRRSCLRSLHFWCLRLCCRYHCSRHLVTVAIALVAAAVVVLAAATAIVLAVNAAGGFWGNIFSTSGSACEAVDSSPSKSRNFLGHCRFHCCCCCRCSRRSRPGVSHYDEARRARPLALAVAGRRFPRRRASRDRRTRWLPP